MLIKNCKLVYLDKIEEGIINVYSENLAEGVDIETIKAMVDAETWLTGEEASNEYSALWITYWQSSLSVTPDANANSSEIENPISSSYP